MNLFRFHIAPAMAACALLLPAALRAQARPAITGLSHMAVYTSDPAAAEHFYAGELGAVKEPDPENPQGTAYRISAGQWIEVLPLPAQHGASRMDHVAFATTDVTEMRRYLLAKGYKDVDAIQSGKDGSRWFYTRDPEGNRIEFVTSPPMAIHATAALVSGRMIHVGFLVKDRAAEDRFYRGLLGFRPYWHGGMAAGKTDWVSLQVPDGHDWLEYMLTGEGSTSPDAAQVGERQLGVMNHFSLGVPNMERAVTGLYVRDVIRYSPRHDGPQMGKDGKWQANLYDPDGTRVELMEFQPVMKPCCSDFTAASPTR